MVPALEVPNRRACEGVCLPGDGGGAVLGRVGAGLQLAGELEGVRQGMGGHARHHHPAAGPIPFHFNSILIRFNRHICVLQTNAEAEYETDRMDQVRAGLDGWFWRFWRASGIQTVVRYLD